MPPPLDSKKTSGGIFYLKTASVPSAEVSAARHYEQNSEETSLTRDILGLAVGRSFPLP
jgi:hypothetical protein